MTFCISGEGFSLCMKNPVLSIKLTPVQLLPLRRHTLRRYHRMNLGCMHRSLTHHACCSKCPSHDPGRSWSRSHPRWGKRFRRSFRSCPYYRGCERQCERLCATRSIVHGRLNQLVLHSGDNKKEGIYPSHSCKLAECVTVDEIIHDFVVTNEPLKVLLKYTISECIAELVDDSVET